MAYLLLAATAISLVAWVVERSHPSAGGGGPLPFDTIVIVAILLLNYIQEAKAERAVDALANRRPPPQPPCCETGRWSAWRPAKSFQAMWSSWPRVTRSARTAASLRVPEASLTGESLTVSKRLARLDKTTALDDRTNMVFNGTAVTQGTGRMVVTSTGMDT